MKKIFLLVALIAPLSLSTMFIHAMDEEKISEEERSLEIQKVTLTTRGNTKKRSTRIETNKSQDQPEASETRLVTSGTQQRGTRTIHPLPSKILDYLNPSERSAWNALYSGSNSTPLQLVSYGTRNPNIEPRINQKLLKQFLLYASGARFDDSFFLTPSGHIILRNKPTPNLSKSTVKIQEIPDGDGAAAAQSNVQRELPYYGPQEAEGNSDNNEQPSDASDNKSNNKSPLLGINPLITHGQTLGSTLRKQPTQTTETPPSRFIPANVSYHALHGDNDYLRLDGKPRKRAVKLPNQTGANKNNVNKGQPSTPQQLSSNMGVTQNDLKTLMTKRKEARLKAQNFSPETVFPPSVTKKSPSQVNETPQPQVTKQVVGDYGQVGEPRKKALFPSQRKETPPANPVTEIPPTQQQPDPTIQGILGSMLGKGGEHTLRAASEFIGGTVNNTDEDDEHREGLSPTLRLQATSETVVAQEKTVTPQHQASLTAPYTGFFPASLNKVTSIYNKKAENTCMHYGNSESEKKKIITLNGQAQTDTLPVSLQPKADNPCNEPNNLTNTLGLGGEDAPVNAEEERKAAQGVTPPKEAQQEQTPQPTIRIPEPIAQKPAPTVKGVSNHFARAMARMAMQTLPENASELEASAFAEYQKINRRLLRTFTDELKSKAQNCHNTEQVFGIIIVTAKKFNESEKQNNNEEEKQEEERKAQGDDNTPAPESNVASPVRPMKEKNVAAVSDTDRQQQEEIDAALAQQLNNELNGGVTRQDDNNIKPPEPQREDQMLPAIQAGEQELENQACKTILEVLLERMEPGDTQTIQSTWYGTGSTNQRQYRPGDIIAITRRFLEEQGLLQTEEQKSLYNAIVIEFFSQAGRNDFGHHIISSEAEEEIKEQIEAQRHILQNIQNQLRPGEGNNGGFDQGDIARAMAASEQTRQEELRRQERIQAALVQQEEAQRAEAKAEAEERRRQERANAVDRLALLAAGEKQNTLAGATPRASRQRSLNSMDYERNRNNSAGPGEQQVNNNGAGAAENSPEQGPEDNSGVGPQKPQDPAPQNPQIFDFISPNTKWLTKMSAGSIFLTALFKYRNDIFNTAVKYIKAAGKIFRKPTKTKKTKLKVPTAARPTVTQPIPVSTVAATAALQAAAGRLSTRQR